MLHTQINAVEILNGNVPALDNFDINWNDTGIASGVKQRTYTASAARPALLEIFAEVITAFNAGSGNVLTLGTDSTATQIFGSSDITEGTPGFYPAANAIFKVRIVADYAVWAKYAGGAGVAQQTTAVVVENTPGTLTAGNATLILTTAIAGFVGSPLSIVVALATNDSQNAVATKFRTALSANAQVAANFTVGGTTNNVLLTAKVAAANDATLNLAYADTTSNGLVDDATSDATTAGVAPATAGKAKFYVRHTPLYKMT